MDKEWEAREESAKGNWEKMVANQRQFQVPCQRVLLEDVEVK